MPYRIATGEFVRTLKVGEAVRYKSHDGGPAWYGGTVTAVWGTGDATYYEIEGGVGLYWWPNVEPIA